MMLGGGPIDLALEFEMLRKIGYNGSVSLELFNVDLWQQNPLAVAQQGYQSLRDLAT
jgi:2-keto-myo-inositol isomerase